jgi:rhodanese-related sulfurtransferase
MRILAALGMLSSLATALLAEETQVAREAPSHYCGIECVYAAAQMCGVHVSFNALLEPKYLTSDTGSSAEALIAALSDLGLHGCDAGFLTVEQLSLFSTPVILHVRAPGAGSAYRHWVLFLGFENGQVTLYDPPRDVGCISASELLAMWDGGAIIVSATPPTTCEALPLPLAFTCVVIGAIISLYMWRRVCSPWKLGFVIPLALCLAAHAGLPTGFLWSPRALEAVRVEASDELIPVIDLEELQRMMRSDRCVLVDARPRHAYAHFHLPGAINVPIDSSYIQLNRARDQLLRGTPVVVYCQSDRCGWADIVAHQLISRGVTQICRYGGGVNEWETLGTKMALHRP